METAIEKKNKTELQAVSSPIEMLRAAKEAGIEPKDIQAFLDVQINWEKREAQKAFNIAMADFKAEALRIKKNKKVSFGVGKAAYSYATLANVVDTVTPVLSKYGLSASWRTQQNGTISVTCRIMHIGGHFEEVTLSAPADNSGSKNSIQAIGSTATYLQRYTLLQATGLATEDQDDDARTAEPITDQQLSAIVDMIQHTKTDEAKFLKYLKIEKLKDMPSTMYEKAMAALKAKEKK